MPETDHDLVLRLKQGDESAFRKLVETYQKRVFNTCLGFVKNEEDADDLAQEVFIAVYKHIHQFRMESSISTWIYKISVTKSLEHLRKEKRKKRFGILRSIFYSDDSIMDIPDFNHPGILAENKERSKILFLAIDKLSENQKTAYMLHKLEDLSYDEIAQILGKNVSAIESLMHRAKNNLQKYLYDYYHAERKILNKKASN